MKLLKILSLILTAALTFALLCGCQKDDIEKYEADKAVCFAFIEENAEKLDQLRSEISQYWCSVSIYTDSSGSVKTSVYGDLYNDMEFLRRLKTAEAYNIVQELLQNEYVDSISILWHNGAVITDAYEADHDAPEIVVHFVSIRKGYFCTAINIGEAQQYAEHITGDWYYEENVGE